MTKILIVSDIAPTELYTAGIVLEQVLKFTNANVEFSCFTFKDDALPNYLLSTYLPVHNSYVARKPNEDWNSIPLPQFFSKVGERFASRDTEKLVREILKINSYRSFDHIIVVIQGQTSIRIYNTLFSFGLPVSTLHWDMWGWWEKSKKVPHNFRKVVDLMYENMRTKGNHIMPSNGFSNKLRLEENSALTLYPCMIEKFVGKNSRDQLSQSNRLDIVFLGHQYAKKEISEFLEMLDLLSWKLSEKEIFLHAFGSQIVSEHQNVINHGWFKYEELPRLISKFHIAFMPYPRSDFFAEVVETSFPSKLATYVSAGLPVIAFAPTHYAAKEFVERIGYTISNNSTGELLISLNYILSNYEELKEETKVIYDEMFSPCAFHRSINTWLDKIGLDIDQTQYETYLRTSRAHISNLDHVNPGKVLSINYVRLLRSIHRPFNVNLLLSHLNRLVLRNRFRLLVLLNLIRLR